MVKTEADVFRATPVTVYQKGLGPRYQKQFFTGVPYKSCSENVCKVNAK